MSVVYVPSFRRIVFAVTVLAVSADPLLAETSSGSVGRRAGEVLIHAQSLGLRVGETAEISARIDQPSRLPPDARLRVSIIARHSAVDGKGQRQVVLSKVLHAMDGDFFTVFTAKAAADYQVVLAPEEAEITLFEGERWRESGLVDEVLAAPRQVIWNDGQTIPVTVSVRVLADTISQDGSLIIESEPNNSADEAQSVPLRETTDDYSLQIVGTSDDIEYFDNGAVGKEVGDDWFRLESATCWPGREATRRLTIRGQGETDWRVT